MKHNPHLRAALHAAVDAFFNVLEASMVVRRTVVREPAMPDTEPSEADRELARAEMRRKGLAP